MTPTEALPLLVVVLLLVSVGGGDVDDMTVTFQGAEAVDALADVHVVAGGTTTVPADATVAGDVYVIGGTARVAGTLEGELTILGGTVDVTESARVTGPVRHVAGTLTVAEGARVDRVTTVEAAIPEPSPARQAGGLLVQFLGLAAAGWWLARHHPRVLGNLGHAVTEHTLASGVVGAIAAGALLVLFVYMAFTIILLPLSVAGLLGLLLVVAYGQLAVAHAIGTRLPIARPERATVAGVAVLLLALEGLGLVPVLGGLVGLAVAAVGVGAVFNTYFGLGRFEPAAMSREALR